MRWLADECVDSAIVTLLRQAGHDVVYVAEEAAGETDDAVLDRASREQRILLTEDKDFGEFAFRSRIDSPAIVLLRVPPGRRQLKWERLRFAIDSFGEDFLGFFTVVEHTRVRRRPLARFRT
ncbi:MAG: DUF5615 family PIN-like protein [Parvibaculaceae bacterium]